MAQPRNHQAPNTTNEASDDVEPIYGCGLLQRRRAAQH